MAKRCLINKKNNKIWLPGGEVGRRMRSSRLPSAAAEQDTHARTFSSLQARKTPSRQPGKALSTRIGLESQHRPTRGGTPRNNGGNEV